MIRTAPPGSAATSAIRLVVNVKPVHYDKNVVSHFFAGFSLLYLLSFLTFTLVLFFIVLDSAQDLQELLRSRFGRRSTVPLPAAEPIFVQRGARGEVRSSSKGLELQERFYRPIVAMGRTWAGGSLNVIEPPHPPAVRR